MKFRRSLKSDNSQKVHFTIPQKDPEAIRPPLKVVRVVHDWQAPSESDIHLTVHAGSFLHIIDRSDATDWYMACDPLKNERGLIPVAYVEEISKTVRNSTGSRPSESTTHDSGYAEATIPPTRPPTNHSSEPNMPAHRPSKSVSRGAPGVYGIVSFDFKAERPDELDAREGEAIIVIAQSNPEWFVAKPITRLGGPGLIPVSFIEIRDMTTGQPVPDTAEAVRRAGIPKVEEWKKMAAEYKNTSIPLGTVSSSQQVQSMQQGMQRMSLSNGQQNGQGQNGVPAAYQQQQQQNLFAPVRASLPRYIFADEKFHFIVECKLSDGSHWDLSRIYEDFYELQINLINAFPEEAGQIPGKERILPYMPGPVKFVTDNISEGRRASLNDYLRDLLRLNPRISGSSLVRAFFAPRQGDYEVDPNEIDLEEHAQNNPQQQRYSAHSQALHPNGGYQQQHPPPQSAYPTSQYNQPSGPNGYSPSRQAQTLQANAPERGHSASPSGSYQQKPHSSSHSAQQSINASGTSLASAPQVKVKAWFDRDTCVVIRMPPRGQFTHSQFYQRIVERRRLEYKGQDSLDDPLEIEYRDDKDGEYYKIEGDEDLDIALERNEKLTLAVRTAER